MLFVVVESFEDVKVIVWRDVGQGQVHPRRRSALGLQATVERGPMNAILQGEIQCEKINRSRGSISQAEAQ